MSSLVLTVFVATNIIFQMSSCQKSEAQTSTTHTIQGLWIGTASTNGSGLPPQYFSLIIKPDGTIISDAKTQGNPNSQYLSVGTWTLNGNNFSYSITNVYGNMAPTYIGQTQNGTAAFSSTDGSLAGGIWNNPSPASSGTFSLTKVN